jgi:hypothetical protein
MSADEWMALTGADGGQSVSSIQGNVDEDTPDGREDHWI